MPISIVNLGGPRAGDEGLRIDTVWRPPRGLRREDCAAKDIYDLWLQNLSPSETLLKEISPPLDERSRRTLSRKFMAEMKQHVARRDLDQLTAP